MRAALFVCLCAATAVGCGGSSTPTTPGGNTTPTVTNTITITSAGVSPKHIQVNAGSRVTFVNNDTRAHFMASDPHPEHTDCQPLAQIGTIPPGQSRESGNLITPRTCGFHDHDNPAESLKGTITIR